MRLVGIGLEKQVIQDSLAAETVNLLQSIRLTGKFF
jgi:hypothetical protein